MREELERTLAVRIVGDAVVGRRAVVGGIEEVLVAVDVEDGRIVGYGQSGEGSIGSTTLRLGKRQVTFQPVAGGTAVTVPVPPDQFPPVR